MQSFLHFLFFCRFCTLSNNICSNWRVYLGIVGMTWTAHTMHGRGECCRTLVWKLSINITPEIPIWLWRYVCMRRCSSTHS